MAPREKKPKLKDQINSLLRCVGRFFIYRRRALAGTTCSSEKGKIVPAGVFLSRFERLSPTLLCAAGQCQRNSATQIRSTHSTMHSYWEIFLMAMTRAPKALISPLFLLMPRSFLMLACLLL